MPDDPAVKILADQHARSRRVSRDRQGTSLAIPFRQHLNVFKVRPCRSRTHRGMQREANHPRSMAQTKGAARQERVRRGIAPPNGSFWPMCDEPRHYICGNVLNDTDRREDHVREPPTPRLLDHTHAVLGGGSRCLARRLSRQRMAGGEDCRPQFSGERQARRQGVRPRDARQRSSAWPCDPRRLLPRA